MFPDKHLCGNVRLKKEVLLQGVIISKKSEFNN